MTTSAKAALDHVILGAADLERASAELERQTGARPVFGGKHPRGTHNALLSLGRDTYLEILAAQTGSAAEAEFAKELGGRALRVVGWAIRTEDGAATRAALQAAGFELSEPQPGSRTTPQNTVLRWETFYLADETAGDPFFIQWAKETPHPATTSPGGCLMRAFTIRTPGPDRLKRLVRALGIEKTVQVESANALELQLSLQCAHGQVSFADTAVPR